jgi:hypothetical protein
MNFFILRNEIKKIVIWREMSPSFQLIRYKSEGITHLTMQRRVAKWTMNCSGLFLRTFFFGFSWFKSLPPLSPFTFTWTQHKKVYTKNVFQTVEMSISNLIYLSELFSISVHPNFLFLFSSAILLERILFLWTPSQAPTSWSGWASTPRASRGRQTAGKENEFDKDKNKI